MANRKTRFCITVTPNRNGKQCFIEWGDGSRSVCDSQGVYVHEYENKTADYNCNIVNAYEFSIGSDDTGDYSKGMVESIPALGDGLGRISDGLYSGMELRGLRIPDSVESIGASAFSGCTKLENLNFPKSLSVLGEYAFDGCNRLRFSNSGELSSSSLTTIPEACFRNCFLLDYMYVPQTVTTIGASAFYSTDVGFWEFPKNLTDVGDYAFYMFGSRGSLPDSTLYLDSHVNRIGDYAFYYFSNLKSIKASGDVDYIGDHAFCDCRYLSSIEFSGDVGTLSSSCFTFEQQSERGNLNKVIFKKNVDTIGDNAFSNHTGFRRVELPSGIRTIGDAAFMYCNNLAVVQNDGVVAESLESIGASAFYNNKLSSFSVGDSLTSIGDRAFAQQTRLSSFHFGDNIVSIGKTAFSGCSNLFKTEKKLVCPKNLKYIGEMAFANCSNITSVEFDDALEEIPALFSISPISDKNTTLASVNIGNGIKTIGSLAFSNCASLKYVDFGSSVKTIGSAAFYECRNLEKVIMPDTVEHIGDAVFMTNLALSSLHLSDSLTAISNSAFSGDKKLKSLELPDSITYIGKGAFNGASLGPSLRIPDSVVEIGNNAFANNRLLEDVSFGSSIKTIGDYAFINSSLSNLSLNEGLEYIGRYCFSSCRSNGGHVVIPSTVSSIGDFAFSATRFGSMDINASSLSELPKNCFEKSSIATYNLSQGITKIGENCFASCYNMSSINLPSRLSSIGDRAFIKCSKLFNLRFENPNAPSTGDSTFGIDEGSTWDADTWAGYDVKDLDNIITIPKNSSGYIINEGRSSLVWWLYRLSSSDYGGFEIYEVDN
jgi:hypothetical protein